MNPHRLTWGITYSMPFAQFVALATLPGFLLTRDRQPLPRTRETYLLLTLWGFFTVSTVLSLVPELSWPQWERVSKIMLFTVMTLMLFQNRQRLRCLLLVIAGSIGFYGFKGGLFAIRSGGEYMVIFPEDTLMGTNNGFGLALNMTLPIFFFLAREELNPWLRGLLRATFFLSIPAVVFTYSRGAALGLGAVLLCIALKTNRRWFVITGATVAVLVALAMAPEKWFSRMETLKTYEQDASAQGRLDAWYVFSQVGLARPLFGAGFWAPSTDEIFYKYAPEAPKARDAHNIFFNVMGEHGVIALGVFIALILCCLSTLRKLRTNVGTLRAPDWVVNYSHMIEASFVAYLVTGFFLSASYLDLFYHLVAFTILLRVLAQRELNAERLNAGSAS
jgi:probable O-glycosylation ligase (exosortase A-associated)